MSKLSKLSQVVIVVVFQKRKDMKRVNMEELESRLRKVLDSVTDADVRHFIVGHLFRYVDNMQTVQYIPTALRLQYYACTYVIFDYLRSNGQLDRTERIFDKEVMRNLGKTLRMLGTELYDEH